MWAWPDARINFVISITTRSYFFPGVYLVDCVYVDGCAGASRFADALFISHNQRRPGNTDVRVQSEKSNITSMKCRAPTSIASL